KATIDALTGESALAGGTEVGVEPTADGWLLRLGPVLAVETGHGAWRESAPLGRPVVATGAWQDDTFVADIYVITSPHRVRLVVDAEAGTATATWNVVPLTSPDLELHLRAPLMTRPDVA
ncbi:MAG TPA: serine hydrolase, partial [Phytomonospora sp.]